MLEERSKEDGFDCAERVWEELDIVGEKEAGAVGGPTAAIAVGIDTEKKYRFV